METPDGYVGHERGEPQLPAAGMRSLSFRSSPSRTSSLEGQVDKEDRGEIRTAPRTAHLGSARVSALEIEGMDVNVQKDDEENPDEFDTNQALPFRGDRNGKWWYSTYHNVTAIVGAGVLGLPSAMAYLGWGIGTVVLLASWVITLYTLWQMVQMHEDKDGKRIDTYHALGQKAFGRKWGLRIVIPQQLIVEVGLDIVYIVLGGQSLWIFYQLVTCDFSPEEIGRGACCGPLGPSAFIIIFILPQFFLAQLGNFNSIAGVSLAASVMSIGYCVIAFSLSIGEGQDKHRSEDVSYAFPDQNRVFGAFSALGTVAFAYAGHNVVLEIQATLPSGEKGRPAKVLMWRGVVVAYIVVAFCYFTVAFTGYWAFGEELASSVVSLNDPKKKIPNSHNILLRLGHPRWALAMANLMVSIHMIGGYQLFAMPVFQMMESLLVNKFRFPPPTRYSPMRIVTRSTYVFLTGFTACTFPFFNSLLGLVGGFALAPTTYFLPCIIWLTLKWKSKEIQLFGVSFYINLVLIFIGVVLMIVATIGGVHSLIQQASQFEFYQFRSKNCR